MLNTLYRYSDGVGLVKKSIKHVRYEEKDKWHDTPDAATIFYLKEQRESYLDAIEMLTKSLSANKDLLKEVEKELQPFKEKYPEEFI